MYTDRVSLQVINAAPGLEWVSMPSWPPPCLSLPAFLSANGSVSLGEKSSSTVTSGTRRYTYFPSDPTPSVGGNGIGFLDGGAKDQKRLEKRDNKDLLVYTSDVLTEDMLLIGYPKVELYVRCLSARAMSADFVVRLCDVSPRGQSLNICDGVRRLNFAELEKDETGAFKVAFNIYPVSKAFLSV